ncbi:MAG: aldo/keto reductase family protein [Xanthomonadales bacterium]|nr:aldo/keto reductase family protein [Gammaproteobacteria bacterium]MBT8053132.1 aldo/keto reductase family protein [Gammaproteobacteria bacterium]NND56216.1 aldo/keto reductase family protein [Xanthomonadales bacterium]NNK52291.1 aldo/keto reductase family protein [Xanthomonadales bacterium]
MKYRRLGNSGVKLSEIGLGGWLTFGHVSNEKTGRELIDKAFECGINFYDTSNVYAAGACEKMWGRLLGSYSRPSYVLATKVYFPMGDGPNDRGLSRKHIMEQCDASLRRLDTEYIDLYQCHRYDDETPLEETLRAMDDLVHQGKILYWGFSCWPADKIQKTFNICGERLYPPVSSQPHYNMLMRDLEVEVLPVCRQHGVGQVVFSPLEQGLLTGKYQPGRPLPATSRAADERQNQWIKELAANEKVLEHIARLQSVASEVGCSIAQLALAWILHKEDVTSCITGATRTAQIEENCGASGIEISQDQLARIDEIILPASFSNDFH